MDEQQIEFAQGLVPQYMRISLENYPALTSVGVLFCSRLKRRFYTTIKAV